MADTIKYGDVVLARPGDHVSRYRLGHARQTQERGPLRAPAGGVFDRRRVAHTVTFRVTRLHASVAAARVFLNAHAQALTAEEATTVSFEFDPAAGFSSFTLTTAAVQSAEASQTGMTTYHDYTVQGGAIA